MSKFILASQVRCLRCRVFSPKREKSTGKIRAEFRSKFSSKSPDSPTVWMNSCASRRLGGDALCASSSALSDEVRKKKPKSENRLRSEEVWGFSRTRRNNGDGRVLRDTETGIRSDLTPWSLTALRQVHPILEEDLSGLAWSAWCYIVPKLPRAYRFTMKDRLHFGRVIIGYRDRRVNIVNKNPAIRR